jgi:hypothetical protein
MYQSGGFELGLVAQDGFVPRRGTPVHRPANQLDGRMAGVGSAIGAAECFSRKALTRGPSAMITVAIAVPTATMA